MALEKITHLTGKAVYVPGDDIDTDRIIPARYMKCVTFDGLGEYMFYDVRFNEDGTRKAHVLNEQAYEGASIMISDSNFGCGSSREHAPQAMYRYGFRAVIAESFAEIFYGNAVTLGMPCIEAEREQIQEIVQEVKARPGTDITIDIENERVTFGDKTISVKVSPTAKDSLTQGRWDPIAELLEGDAEVSETAQSLPYIGQ